MKNKKIEILKRLIDEKNGGIEYCQKSLDKLWYNTKEQKVFIENTLLERKLEKQAYELLLKKLEKGEVK